MKKYLLIFLPLLLLFVACQSSVYFEKEYQIAPEGWTYADLLNFEVDISDTSRLHNLFIDIVHKPDFASQNLYTKIHTEYPSGERMEDVVSFELANKAGAWFGACSSKKCRLRIPILTNTYFQKKGKHTFTIEQFMREDSLAGIYAIGFRVEDIGARGE